MIKCFNFGENDTSKKGTRQAASPAKPIKITSLNYGPYDNGHIILGMSNGFILILNSLDLSSMFRFRVFETSQIQANPTGDNQAQEIEKPVTKLIFDPTQMILATTTP